MKINSYITKSRAGHYTVTIRNDKYKNILFKQNLINTIQKAKWILETQKSKILTLPTEEHYIDAIGPCGK